MPVQRQLGSGKGCCQGGPVWAPAQPGWCAVRGIASGSCCASWQLPFPLERTSVHPSCPDGAWVKPTGLPVQGCPCGHCAFQDPWTAHQDAFGCLPAPAFQDCWPAWRRIGPCPCGPLSLKGNTPGEAPHWQWALTLPSCSCSAWKVTGYHPADSLLLPWELAVLPICVPVHSALAFNMQSQAAALGRHAHKPHYQANTSGFRLFVEHLSCRQTSHWLLPLQLCVRQECSMMPLPAYQSQEGPAMACQHCIALSTAGLG